MDSLASYTSEGEESTNSDDTKMPYPERETVPSRRASDVNYDPVQMDMSEESNNNNSSAESDSERGNSPAIPNFHRGPRNDAGRSYSSSSDQRRSNHEPHGSNTRNEHRKERADRPRHAEDKNRRSTHEDRRRDSDHRDGKDSKKSKEAERKTRDDDRHKERSTSRSNKDDRNEEKEKTDKDHHHHRDDRRGDRDRRRDRDRDRRHGKEDRGGKDRYREDRSSYQKEKERIRSRSRSRSRDHVVAPFRTMSYREEKSRNKLAQLEKLGIELKAPEGGAGGVGIGVGMRVGLGLGLGLVGGGIGLGGDNNTASSTQGEQNFYSPLTTATQGKYAEQIQKRKLLWANKSKPEDGKPTSSATATANTWVGTTFTHDQDGKVTAKFKRLMGIKGDLPMSVPAAGAKPEILKKQEEMFNNMEQQYEVARATTHTQRGVGFGYATGGYQFPR